MVDVVSSNHGVCSSLDENDWCDSTSGSVFGTLQIQMDDVQ
jgi:hypothetical protein